MSYQALYRKFRPLSFEDVKGQDHIVTTLRNQLLSDRIGHAYLFTGTRGTGKTTIAKIFAKAVNCEHPTENGPCGECELCQAIAKQNSMNVIEIDAASNNGVDNIREIIDEVQYSPTQGRYKVYIIDEVHMLSAGAFNALLKTLEEPPSYVIFILATTEVHKIPITILSRCQRYDFKRISMDTVAERLRELVDKEQVDAEDRALRYIAKAADGSMRDGLSLLDQCIAFYFGKKLTYDNVLDVLGAVDTEVYNTLLEQILSGAVEEAMNLVERIVVQGRELTQFVVEFTWYLRNLLLVATADTGPERLDLSTEDYERLRGQATRIEMDMILRYIRIFSELSGQMRYAAQKRILLEVAIIKLCKPEMETKQDALVNRIRNLEQRIEQGLVMTMQDSGVPGTRKENPRQIEQEPEKIQEALQRAVPEELQELARNWNEFLGRIPMPQRHMFTGVIPSVGEGNTLLLIFPEDVQAAYFEKEEELQFLNKLLTDFTHREIPVQIRYNPPSQESNEIFNIAKVVHFEIEEED